MKKLTALILIITFPFFGCSMIKGGTKGKTKTYYDANGNTTLVEEEKMIDDKYSNYGNTVYGVVDKMAKSETAAINAITEVYKPRTNDSELASLAKAAIAGAQITAIKVAARFDLVLAQIKYGKDGYDVADTFAGGFVQMITTAIPWLAAGSMIKRGFDSAGDKTDVSMGNDNYVTLKQEKTNSNAYITAGNNGGDNSYVTVPYSPNITGSSPPTTQTTEVLAPTTPTPAQ